jgi:hypothetical protein
VTFSIADFTRGAIARDCLENGQGQRANAKGCLKSNHSGQLARAIDHPDAVRRLSNFRDGRVIADHLAQRTRECMGNPELCSF